MWLLLLLVLTVLFIIVATAKLRLHPFLALMIAAFGYGLLCGHLTLVEVVETVNTGFGGTIGYIGIVIIAGSIIGVFLEKSGGAYRLAERTIQFTGKRNVPLAMSVVGYIVSIPVFCDSGFVILSPLNRGLSRKAKTSLAGGAVALALGLYATHTMVPPTPGPMAAAALLRADLGLVILWGLLVSLVALAAGLVFAVGFASRTVVHDRLETEEIPEEPGDTPSAGKSILPILIPILLIVLRSVSELPSRPFGGGGTVAVIQFIGHPVVALFLGVVLACLLPRRLSRDMLSTDGWVGKAVITASIIIVITGAGGAFGKILQESGIDAVVKDRLAGVHVGIWLPFLIAAALKTAQGSSTVAITTTAGIMVPLVEVFGLDAPNAKALVVVAIGAGSMVVSHANDSYFWVVTQLSGMSVKQGYKLQTLGTLVEGCAAALTVWLISLVVL